VDEAIEKKQVFLVARDEKNYYGGGVPRPDKDCFLATKDALVLCTELGVEGKIDDMNRDEHRDFRMFLTNGGMSSGNIIKAARGKTYLGQNESWQDEMERTMLYLGMEEDENEQPPVADRLGSPRGTPAAARKRAASNFFFRPLQFPREIRSDNINVHFISK